MVFYYVFIALLFQLFGYYKINDTSIKIPCCQKCIGITFATGMTIFKFVWFVMFALAYMEQVPDCLRDQDETFAAAYIFLKPLFIVEAIPAIFFVLVICHSQQDKEEEET